MTVAADLVRMFTRADWMNDAACRGMDQRIFYVAHGASTDKAKATCDTCPVSAECRQYAVDNRERHGIWAGQSADVLRRRTTTPRTGPTAPRGAPIEHGTIAGYAKHRRRGEAVCDACGTAKRNANAAARARRRAAA